MRSRLAAKAANQPNARTFQNLLKQSEGGGIPRPLFLPMITYHLNDAQRAFIVKWLLEHQKRPSFGAYDKACRDIKKLPTAAKPPAKAIPSSKPGFNAGEIVPSSRFNATKHLPPGWAAYNMHDSGGNHRLVNAGQAMLTTLWNHWAKVPDAPFSLRAGMVASGLAKQFAANLIDYRHHE